MSRMSEFIRKTFEEGDNIRDDGLTTPEGIARHDGILYGTSPDWQILDVYRPERLEGEFSLLPSGPDFQFPNPLEDTNLVFDWVLKSAGVYDFDTENIFAVGDSAGAHILGMYAAMTISFLNW